MDLFAESRKQNLERVAPLAVRMRPRTLDEFVGQQHFLGPGKLLRRMLEADRLSSAIFYGPPGTGKTTLAQVIAHKTRGHFEQLNAAAVGVKEVRAILDDARDRLSSGGGRTVLFLDEIHRFNRAQQDILLPDVENGLILLIGATTENPFFSVNSPLVSRSGIFQFTALSEADICSLLLRAIADKERGLGQMNLEVDREAIEHWARTCDGDARRALTALEVAALSLVAESGAGAPTGTGGTARAHDDGQQGCVGVPAPRVGSPCHEIPASTGAVQNIGHTGSTAAATSRLRITLEVAEQSIQRKAIVYDAAGDEHYDAASALIKSMRGSDPDAAVYWVAKMLEAGEDPRFIARRIAILASEDIGNADPRAIMVAAAAYNIVERIGMPECQLTLAQAAIYMATTPKSNASAKAIWAAMADVREGRTIPVPKHLRDTHYAGAERLGHGQSYQYPHDSDKGYVAQEYLGVDKTYYVPADRGYEAAIGRYLQWLRGGGPPVNDPAQGVSEKKNGNAR